MASPFKMVQRRAKSVKRSYRDEDRGEEREAVDEEAVEQATESKVRKLSGLDRLTRARKWAELSELASPTRRPEVESSWILAAFLATVALAQVSEG